jgi:hypothetical protein
MVETFASDGVQTSQTKFHKYVYLQQMKQKTKECRNVFHSNVSHVWKNKDLNPKNSSPQQKYFVLTHYNFAFIHKIGGCCKGELQKSKVEKFSTLGRRFSSNSTTIIS